MVGLLGIRVQLLRNVGRVIVVDRRVSLHAIPPWTIPLLTDGHRIGVMDEDA